MPYRWLGPDPPIGPPLEGAVCRDLPRRPRGTAPVLWPRSARHRARHSRRRCHRLYAGATPATPRQAPASAAFRPPVDRLCQPSPGALTLPHTASGMRRAAASARARDEGGGNRRRFAGLQRGPLGQVQHAPLCEGRDCRHGGWADVTGIARCRDGSGAPALSSAGRRCRPSRHCRSRPSASITPYRSCAGNAPRPPPCGAQTATSPSRPGAAEQTIPRPQAPPRWPGRPDAAAARPASPRGWGRRLPGGAAPRRRGGARRRPRPLRGNWGRRQVAQDLAGLGCRMPRISARGGPGTPRLGSSGVSGSGGSCASDRPAGAAAGWAWAGPAAHPPASSPRRPAAIWRRPRGRRQRSYPGSSPKAARRRRPGAPPISGKPDYASA